MNGSGPWSLPIDEVEDPVVYDIPPRYARLIHIALGTAGTSMGAVVTLAIYCVGG